EAARRRSRAPAPSQAAVAERLGRSIASHAIDLDRATQAMVGQAVVIIRACRERALLVDYLQRRLPDAVIIWDRRRDAMDTFLLALEAAGDGPALHMEDDV